jgi:hypothetical protein
METGQQKAESEQSLSSHVCTGTKLLDEQISSAYNP